MEKGSDADLFYTCPMSLSKTDAELIRQKLLATIEEAVKILGPSPSETTQCLNIDWFEF